MYRYISCGGVFHVNLLVCIKILIFPHRSDNRPFRIGGGANMERVVRMDREMTKV